MAGEENQICVPPSKLALVPVLVATFEEMEYEVRTAKSRNSVQIFYKLKR